MQRKTDFILIGAQKAGTTSLYNWIAQHPDIFAPNHVKDHPFFSSDESYMKGIGYYHKQYGKFPKGKVLGAGSVQYSYYEQVPKRIYNYNPNSKLIFIIRNPIERAKSAYSYAVERDLESRSFSDAIDFEISKGANKYDSAAENNQKNYLYRGLYAYQIRNYLKYFPKEQIYINTFDNLKSTPKQVLVEIFSFLEVDEKYISSISFSIKNQTKGASKSSLINSLIYSEKLRNNVMIRMLRKLIPLKYKSFLASTLVNANRKKSEPQAKLEVSNNITKIMYSFYKRDIEETERLTGLNLSHWKK